MIERERVCVCAYAHVCNVITEWSEEGQEVGEGFGSQVGSAEYSGEDDDDLGELGHLS